jgi:regulator of replication initiation timing
MQFLILATIIVLSVAAQCQERPVDIQKKILQKQEQFEAQLIYLINLSQIYEGIVEENQNLKQELAKVDERLVSLQNRLDYVEGYATLKGYGRFYIHNNKVDYREGQKICKLKSGFIVELTNTNHTGKLNAIIDGFSGKIFGDSMSTRLPKNPSAQEPKRPRARHWKDHFKSDFRSDQDHLLEK